MKLLLADRHRLMLEGLRAALEVDQDIEVVGETHQGSQVLPLVDRLEPDVVLLDVGMSDVSGLSCLELLQEHHPAVKVIILGTSGDLESEHAALAYGAQGYIANSLGLDELALAIREAVEAPVYRAFGPALGDAIGPGEAAGLTSREVAILRAAARGLSNRAIGNELWVTEQTVKFHLTNIYRKLNVRNRTEATRAGLRLGVVESSGAGPVQT